jgi:hypothetical protein
MGGNKVGMSYPFRGAAPGLLSHQPPSVRGMQGANRTRSLARSRQNTRVSRRRFQPDDPAFPRAKWLQRLTSRSPW